MDHTAGRVAMGMLSEVTASLERSVAVVAGYTVVATARMLMAAFSSHSAAGFHYITGFSRGPLASAYHS